MCIRDRCTTVSAPELKKFLLEKGFDPVEEDAETVVFRGKDNVRLKFFLADDASFCKKLFQTSCSEDFLVGWEKQYSIPAGAKSEEQIFQSAGVPFIIPALRENDTIIGLSLIH